MITSSILFDKNPENATKSGWPVFLDEFHPAFTLSEPGWNALGCLGAKLRFDTKVVVRCPFVGSIGQTGPVNMMDAITWRKTLSPVN